MVSELAINLLCLKYLIKITMYRVFIQIFLTVCPLYIIQ